MIKVCIVNRNFPPYRGATGYHAAMLADYLHATGNYKVSAVTLGHENILNQAIQVHALSPNYTGRNKGLRLLSTTREGYRLIKKALSLNADFYIILTDPPLLNYWAARLLKEASWALWTMDLYPQGFVAGGLAKEGDTKTNHYIKTLQSGLPNLIISLGKQQRAFLENIYPRHIESIKLPIGLKNKHNTHGSEESIPWDTSKITLGYVGNLSEAHHPDHISEIAHNLDPQSMQLVLCCYGAHAIKLKQSLQHFDHVIILSHIEEGHMNAIDVHIVSLAKAWTHICVPSKALSAIQFGRPVLFIGDQTSDTSAYIRKAGWVISDLSELKDTLASLTRESILTKASKAKEIEAFLNQELQSGWQQIDQFISNT